MKFIIYILLYIFPSICNIDQCYNLRDWLDGTEDSGGTWTAVEVPDGDDINLVQLELIGDSPCYEPKDCGVYRFVYRVSCEDCAGLYSETEITWVVPCGSCETEIILTGTCN